MNGIENSRADARLFDTSRFARQIEKVLASGINGKAPVITLSSGYDMPMVGLGTYSLHGRVCINSICTAIQNGYRLIDTASF